jgi:uncharacterized protein (DUF486 family)
MNSEHPAENPWKTGAKIIRGTLPCPPEGVHKSRPGTPCKFTSPRLPFNDKLPNCQSPSPDHQERVFLRPRLTAAKDKHVNPVVATISLLMCSNVFMTFAWYAHLKELNNKPWIIAAMISWGIALLEYCFQVPANRIGYTVLSVGQLKIVQEVITLGIFVPFSLFYLKEPLKLDYLWAGICLVGAVFFMFRSKFV